MRGLNPQAYDEDKKEFEGGGILGIFNPLNYFFITKSICRVFDTGQKIERSAPAPLRHIQRVCERDDCGVVKLQHV